MYSWEQFKYKMVKELHKVKSYKKQIMDLKRVINNLKRKIEYLEEENRYLLGRDK